MLVFPNERKANERDPDFVVYLVPAERREGGPARGEGRPARSDNDFADHGSRSNRDSF